MAFIDAHGLVHGIRGGTARHPLAVGEFVMRRVETGGGAGTAFRPEGIGVGLLQIAAVARFDLELIALPLAGIRDVGLEHVGAFGTRKRGGIRIPAVAVIKQ